MLAGRRVSSLTGPSFGLNLIIALDQANYLKGGMTKQVRTNLLLNKTMRIFFCWYRGKFIFYYQAGARLVVQNPMNWPLVDEMGMDISPATSTLARISEVREEFPYFMQQI